MRINDWSSDVCSSDLLLVDQIFVEEGAVTGVLIETGEVYDCRAVILASGTYLRGKIILGEMTYTGGPNGQRSAEKLSEGLKQLGVQLMRFKTGTPARVDSRTVDVSKMSIQPGDDQTHNFSFLSTIETR